MSDSTDAIEANIAAPKKVEGDGVKVENHSLKDQIEAANFLDSSAAMDLPSRGLRFSRHRPPGAS